jgi:hypothetical protein
VPADGRDRRGNHLRARKQLEHPLARGVEPPLSFNDLHVGGPS